jgi:hypothetical protein
LSSRESALAVWSVLDHPKVAGDAVLKAAADSVMPWETAVAIARKLFDAFSSQY